jgi:anti-sigma factor RsiW
MTRPWPQTLPCGHDMAELILQVADGIPGDLAHQATCPHCQQALAALEEVWAAAAALALEQVTAPPQLHASVLRRVRRDIFVSQVSELIGGIVPRLSRALLVYAGVLGGSERR